MFENEWFPKANAIGVSWKEFWGMNPHIIKLLLKGHEEKIKEQDYMAWLSNQYTLSAVSVAVEHCLAGKKAKSKYIEKPIMQEMANKKIESKPLTEEDKKKQTEKLFMQLRIMGANFNLKNKENKIEQTRN